MLLRGKGDDDKFVLFTCNLLLLLQLTIAGLADGGVDFADRKRAEHSHDEKVETDGEVIAEHDS